MFDILHYSTKISCQVHLKHVFYGEFRDPFLSIPVRSGPFRLVNSPLCVALNSGRYDGFLFYVII